MQLVTRALGVYGEKERHGGGPAEFFQDQNVRKKEFMSTSQQFVRYNLVPPKSEETGGSGEGEDGDDNEDKLQGQRKSALSASVQDLYQKGKRNYGGDKENFELYKDYALYEEIDQLQGVNCDYYAELGKSTS